MLSLRACIDVPDLDTAIAFYTSALLLTVGRRFEGAWVELLGAGSPIDLVKHAEGSRPTARADALRSYQRHWTPVHLDFVVDALEPALARAQAAGATVEQPIAEKPWGRIAILADPFGHGLCLLEFTGRGYDEVINPGA